MNTLVRCEDTYGIASFLCKLHPYMGDSKRGSNFLVYDNGNILEMRTRLASSVLKGDSSVSKRDQIIFIYDMDELGTDDCILHYLEFEKRINKVKEFLVSRHCNGVELKFAPVVFCAETLLFLTKYIEYIDIEHIITSDTANTHLHMLIDELERQYIFDGNREMWKIDNVHEFRQIKAKHTYLFLDENTKDRLYNLLNFGVEFNLPIIKWMLNSNLHNTTDLLTFNQAIEFQRKFENLCNHYKVSEIRYNGKIYN